MSDSECRFQVLTEGLARDLWRRLRRIVLDEAEQRVVPQFRPLLPDVHTGEEFIAAYLQDCLRRSSKGTLAPNFDPSRGTLVEYLSATRLLRRRACDFRKSLHQDRGAPLDAAGEAAAPSVDGRRSALASAATGLFRSVRLCWPVSKPSVIDIMAAVQLWPRLDRDQPAWSAIERTVSEAIGGTDAIARLEEEHAAAQRDVAKQMGAIRRQAKDGRVSLREHRRQSDSQYRLMAAGIRQPLDAAALNRLLGLATSTAHKQLERYRDRLPALVEGLAAAVAELGLVPGEKGDADG